MPDIITCEFTGRLGNNMFQKAAVIGTALKHGVGYCFPPDLPPTIDKYYNETVYEFKEIPYDGGVLCLSGFFQSEKYFIHCREEIIKVLGFKWELPLYDLVSIHVRRQDYKEGTPFEPITMEYITKATHYFQERGCSNFLVFSDDMEWCKANIHTFNFPDCSFQYEHNDEMTDMGLMQNCEHNIIANSTFSWWGAWLNQNPNKIVVAPKKWFDGVNKDLLPDSWIKV